jgi:hypothetical protein
VPLSGHEAKLRLATHRPLSSVHRELKAFVVHREWTESMPLFHAKAIPFPDLIPQSCTEALGLSANSDLALVFKFYL